MEKIELIDNFKLKWPKGKKFAIILTHDVDRIKKSYQYFTRFIYFLKKYKIKKAINELFCFLKYYLKIEFEHNPYWNFERILEIEKKYKVKSTFFFLNECGKIKLFEPNSWKLYLGRYKIKSPPIVNIIKKLDSEGWEIALHGSYESYNNKDLLKKEKEELENILGKKIYGIRQHYLNLKIPDTWKLQEELGFKYDSSFSYRNQTKFEKFHHFPFFPFENFPFLVLPLAIMDSDLISRNNQENIWLECVKKIELVEKLGGVLTINWHQERCNDIEFHNNLKIYEDIIKLGIEKDAWVTNAYELYKWIISEKLSANK